MSDHASRIGTTVTDGTATTGSTEAGPSVTHQNQVLQLSGVSKMGGLGLSRLRRGVEDVLIFVFVIMLGVVLLQVAGRYVRPLSFAGTEEIANFAQVWLVLVGSGVAMRYGRHVAVDVLVTQLPIPIARLLNVLIVLACLWFLGVVFLGALPLLDMGLFEHAPATRVPMWTMYLSLNVGAVYLGFEMIMWLARRWNDPYGKLEAKVE